MDCSENPQTALTVSTLQYIHVEDSSHQFSPGVVFPVPSLPLSLAVTTACLGGCRRRHDPCPPFRRGRKNAMEPDQVLSQQWNQHSQFFQKFQRFENYMCGSIPPHRLQPVTQPS